MGKPRRKKPASPDTPQRGRAGNLLDSVKNSFTPEVVHRASSTIGEPEAATRRALEVSASKVIGGVSRLISSREDAEDLQALLDKSNFQSLADNVPALFSGGKATASAATAGEQLLGQLFGRNVSPVTEQVASAGGVKTASAGKLLALVAPLALGLLAKRASTEALNTSEIANLLTGANTEAGDAAEGARQDASRPRRWGPVLVPKQVKEDVGARPETFVDPADELSPAPEDMTAQRGPAPHPVRRIVFLLAALAALALLILLLIRGPAHPRSHNARPGILAMSRTTLSTAGGLASVEVRGPQSRLVWSDRGMIHSAVTCFIRQNLIYKRRWQSW